MDTLSPLTVLWYSRADARAFLMQNRHRLHENKVAELKVGWLITEHFFRNGGTESYVGFLLKDGLEAKERIAELSLAYIMDHAELIADADYDIVLTLDPSDESDINRVEITRVAGKAKGTWRDSADIIDLLKKKFLRQPDKAISLAISVENDCAFKADPVREFIKSKKPPYGNIWLIGKTDPQKWTFRLIALHPIPTSFDEYSLD